MPAQPKVAPVRLVELDFGDADLVVTEFPDGMFTLEMNNEHIVLNVEQLGQVVDAFSRLGKARGWL